MIPRSSNEYEWQKRKQVSLRTTWVVMISCLAFGWMNLDMASWSSVTVIAMSGLVCVIALVACYTNRLTLAAVLVCGSVLVAVTYSIYDGDGLLDPGIVGYPIILLLGTMLLDKRYTPWLALASILSVVFIGLMQQNGLLHLTIHINDSSNILPITIFLVASALIVWVILDNIEHSYTRLSESELKLRQSYDLTIVGLSKALDLRDVGTGGHSVRVVELTEKLAQALGVSEEGLLHIRRGAYLHDIGKMGIPDSILLKPGPLTAEEWNIMYTHPLLAAEMLGSIPYLAPALDIPKFHHEHWDGSGYPQHLAGAEIPLAARIFTVVDVWDALTSVRPYRPAWTEEQARSFIAEHSDKLFDPQVVQMFLKII